ncbi:unnamed protein product [Sphenostylis stenocarpa]|uniref:Uncharacterized protein n=1 Tax=Sphenostylis stenocarpa TaxID=92480 RepID=A0AA86S0J8_9FABA|nr:unnamed protein product [Sphenostylis stenocarpa]
MRTKSPLQLLTILLVFSFVLSSAAGQTRRLLSHRENLPTQISSDKAIIYTLGVQELRNGEEVFDVAEELMVERGIDLESDDYPGTGANTKHKPKSPPGAT